MHLPIVHPSDHTYLPGRGDDYWDGEVNVVRVYEADGEARVARKRRMHRIVRQDLAIDPVVGGRGDGSDHVGRVLKNKEE